MRFLGTCLAALLLLASWETAEGQSDTAVRAKVRADCRLARQILTQGQPAKKQDWALGVIHLCGDLDQMLVDLWQDPSESEEELQKLFELSRRVRDGELFTTVREIAASPSRPSLVRITALGVMASYVDPELTLHLDRLTRLEGYGPIEWSTVWGGGADLVPQREADPLPPDFERTTRKLADRLAEGAEDSKVRASAWWLVHLEGLGLEDG